jgi:hypothetical protein
MTRRGRTIGLALASGAVVIGIGLYLASSGALGARAPQVERADAAPVVALPAPTQPPAHTIPPSAAPVPTAFATPTPIHRAEIDLASITPTPSPTPVSVYSAFDFLRDYLTNRTYPNSIDGTPWENSSVNIQQYQQPLGGVSYWDFWSEHENWDSPFYMYQDDNGNWHPYQTVSTQNAAGQNVHAYLLVDRKGPGVMDKIWFTEDAVWMLTTEQSRKDVGPIPDMQDFIEWGDLEKLGNLRIEVDDQTTYDGAIKDWFSGQALGLTPALAQILTWRHREYGSSGSLVPIPYQQHLRVLLYGGSKKPKWFMATGVRFPETTRIQAFEKSDLPIAQMTRLAQNVLQPETYIDSLGGARVFTLQADARNPAAIRFTGTGTVSALQILIPKDADPTPLWLRVTYGSAVGIDLPLVAFFGDHSHLVLHRSTPLGAVESTDGYLFYSNLPMPFQDGMTIELENRGARAIDVTVRVAVSRDANGAQLRVLYRPAEKLSVYGPDYRVELPGDGKLVGLVLVSQDQGLDAIPKIIDPKTGAEDTVKRAWPMGYLEGNLMLKDGAGHHRLYGGQEDWADGGFYFNRGYTSPPGGSNRPFGGILRYKDGRDGYATIFRYFDDLAAFRFQNGLQMDFGHGTWDNNFPVQYGVTAYYYEEAK